MNLLIRKLTLTFTLAALAAGVRAETYNWQNAGSGAWQDGDNWDKGIPATSGSAYINNGGTAILDSGSVTLRNFYMGYAAGDAGAMLISGSAVVTSSVAYIGRNGNGTLTLSDHATWTNSTMSNGGFNISYANSGTGIVNVTDYAVLQAAGSIYLGSTLTNVGHGILNVSGHGTVITTQLSLRNDAVVTLADNASLISGDSSNGLLFLGANNATLNITGDKVKLTKTDGTASNIQDTGGTPTINFNHGGNLLFENRIDGTNITVNAVSGTTTLTGINAYTRGTTVSGGATLVASNETALGTGSVLVEVGGVLALGDGIDTLTLGNGDITIHGLLSLGLGDLLSGTGNLILDGGLLITGDNLSGLNLNDFFSGFATTSFDGLNITATDGNQLYQGTLGAGGALTFETVPEPSTWALLGAGLGILCIITHRRKTAGNQAK